MSSPISIPESVSLAMHALAKLAASADGEYVILPHLHLRPGSDNHLSKVMQKLNHIGMVKSRRGQDGGFCLAVHPSDIRLMDIWIAFEGIFETAVCPYTLNGCESSCCLFGPTMQDASNLMKEYFVSKTVDDLAAIYKGE